ncbi:MAG: tRNA (N(6)-L-threonylcarbamoyladenosine(37)-C(2))-methylthiotransferase MtaB, partial [Clostridiales bacterium]|nr:tRNA (N(6)-L-threonylcarbamoyladenosine(37)-C(2))-methylthiotransferase MtaB [Clostridiales bacterium]
MKKTAAFLSLGCKVNSYETEAMRESFVSAGYDIVDFKELADVYVINTCTVTNIADRKSRQMLHQAKKRNPEAIIAAVGCYVQASEEALLEDSSVDIVVGNNKKSDIVTLVERY